MRPLRLLRNHPVALLALIAAGFGAWLVSDALGPPPPPPFTEPPQDLVLGQVSMPVEAQAGTTETGRPGVITADLVARLLPGMSRADVEGLVGPPPADLVSPVAEVDGRLTYRAAYLANLDPDAPNTVRPISPPGPRGLPVPKSLISLEFDATRPGHPLVKVHLPEPVS